MCKDNHGNLCVVKDELVGFMSLLGAHKASGDGGLLIFSCSVSYTHSHGFSLTQRVSPGGVSAAAVGRGDFLNLHGGAAWNRETVGNKGDARRIPVTTVGITGTTQPKVPYYY